MCIFPRNIKDTSPTNRILHKIVEPLWILIKIFCNWGKLGFYSIAYGVWISTKPRRQKSVMRQKNHTICIQRANVHFPVSTCVTFVLLKKRVDLYCGNAIIQCTQLKCQCKICTGRREIRGLLQVRTSNFVLSKL